MDFIRGETIHEKYMKKRLFTRVFLSVILSVVITIVALTTILYQYFVNIIMQQTYTMMSKDLQLAGQNTDNLVESASQTSLRIYNDALISKLTYAAGSENSDVRAALAQLDYYRAIHPYIDSIYVFNGPASTFYVSSSKVSNAINDADVFYDRHVIDNYANYQNLNPVPRVINDPSQKHDPDIVYSFMYFGAYESVKRPDYAVVINVSSDWVDRTMNGKSGEDGNKMYILDAEGRVVSGNPEYPFMKEMSGEPFMRSIRSDGAKDGYIIGEAGGTKSVVAYLHLSSCDWVYIQETPYRQIIAKVDKLRTNTMLTSLIILVTGLLVSLLIFQLFYRPVNKIVSRLRKLESQSQESVHTLKQHFLREWVSKQDKADPKTLRNKIDEYGIKVDLIDGDVLLVLLKIDEYKKHYENYGHKDRQLLQYALLNVAEEVCSRTFAMETVKMNDGQVLLILDVSAESEKDDTRIKVMKSLAETQESIKEYLKISVSIVIGSLTQSDEGIVAHYNELLEASLHTFIYGRGCIIDTGEVAGFKSNRLEYPDQQEKALIEQLMSGKINECKSTYLDTIRDSHSQPYSVFMMNVTRLLYAIDSAVETIQSNGMLSFHASFVKLIYDGSETLDELNEKVLELLDKIDSLLKSRKNTNSDILIHKIVELIHTDYMNPDLSVEYFANMIKMSPTHLSRLFKQHTPETINGYTNRVRMEKAKELLGNTDDTIDQIALKVGFSSTTYFFKCFKKYYGVTPGELRLKHHFRDKL
ncbi:AraC family transcriptional regulator [Cohnella soli]|uniref:AraC family transcriptional regulator n=1 Tax=Cohnella soli TaxID=425005 RepID=A0ABW0I554_9BACL